MNFISYLKSQSYSEKSIESYVSSIGFFKNWLKEEGLNINLVRQIEILSYLEYCKTMGNENRTLSHKLNILRHYFSYLNLSPNPCLHLKIRGLVKRLPSGLLSEKELIELHNNYPSCTVYEHRDKQMLSLLIYQGITTRELLDIELSDIDLERSVIKIRSSRRTESRCLKLKESQVFELSNYLKRIRPSLAKESKICIDKLILTSGKSKNEWKVRHAVAALMRGLKRRYMYFKNARQIRSSRIVLWLKQYNLREVQYMSGHRYISSTERYRMDKLEDLERALGKHHPMRNK